MFYPGKSGSLFCTGGIPLCRNDIFPCNGFSSSKQEDNLIHAYKGKLKKSVNKP